jgi:hypothetical protein
MSSIPNDPSVGFDSSDEASRKTQRTLDWLRIESLRYSGCAVDHLAVGHPLNLLRSRPSIEGGHVVDSSTAVRLVRRRGRRRALGSLVGRPSARWRLDRRPVRRPNRTPAGCGRRSSGADGEPYRRPLDVR